MAAADEARGQRVEQHGVHVVAHAEGEELGALGRGLLGELEDAIGLLDAHRGQPVGQEDDRAGTLAVEELHASLEGAGDVRVAAGLDVADVVDAGLGILGRSELLVEGADVAREVDDGESVVRPQVVQDVVGGVDGLLHLLALHGARAVDDEDDVAGDRLVEVHDGSEEQAEVAILALLPVGQEARVDEALAAGEVEPEVGVGVPVGRAIPSPGPSWPGPSRSSSSSKPGASAERTSQGTSTSTLTSPAAGRGDMRDQGTSTMACSPSASSGVVTVKLTWRSSPAGTGKARTS